MAIISKYSTDDVEQMLQEVIAVLDDHQAPTDLALMVLGNATTTLINQRIAPQKRASLASSFAKALTSSVDKPDTH
jgi:uncharacterized protein YejL (UPF0352 family)